MRKAVQLFEQDFARWDLHIPADALAARRGGQIREAGWSVRFDFGCDGGGEYIDYYGSPRGLQHEPPGDDWHVRLYDSGERVDMPPVLEAYLYGRDPTSEELERARQPFYRPGSGPADLGLGSEESADGAPSAEWAVLDVPPDLSTVETHKVSDDVEVAQVEPPDSDGETRGSTWPQAPDSIADPFFAGPSADPFVASTSADISYLPLDIGLDVELNLAGVPPQGQDEVEDLPSPTPLEVSPSAIAEADPEVEAPSSPSLEVLVSPASLETPAVTVDETPAEPQETGPEVQPVSAEVLSPAPEPIPEISGPEIGIESTDDESFAAWLASPLTLPAHGDDTHATDAMPGLLRSDTEFTVDRLTAESDAARAPIESVSLSPPEPRAPIESIEVSEPEPEATSDRAPAEADRGTAPGAEPAAVPVPSPEPPEVRLQGSEVPTANPWEDIDKAPAPEADDKAPVPEAHVAAHAGKAESPRPAQRQSRERLVREGPSVTGPGRRSRGMVIERAFGGTPLGLERMTDAEILQPWWSRAANRRRVMAIAAALLVAIAATAYLSLRSRHAWSSASQPDDAAAMDSGVGSPPADSLRAQPVASPDTLATPARTQIQPDTMAAVPAAPADSAAPDAAPAEEPTPTRNAAAQEEAVARPAGPGSIPPIISSHRPARSMLRH